MTGRQASSSLSSCFSAGIEPPSASYSIERKKDYVALVSESSHTTLVSSTARLRWPTWLTYDSYGIILSADTDEVCAR